jgi:hypothetical protein
MTRSLLTPFWSFPAARFRALPGPFGAKGRRREVRHPFQRKARILANSATIQLDFLAVTKHLPCNSGRLFFPSREKTRLLTSRYWIAAAKNGSKAAGESQPRSR